MIEKNSGLYTGSKVPQILKNAIQMAVHSGNYLNSSDFIRDAIKEKLLREGFLQSVNVSIHKESENLE
jgi:Arc/MetJ-type ribon-helix-helix transcriptional regulator